MNTVGGELRDHTIHSLALLRDMQVHVYLPPDFDPSQRYPLVVLLHPWGMDEHYWTAHLRAHEAADHLIASGAIPPFIAVMPQGDKSFFINAADPGGDFTPIARLDPMYEDALSGYGDYADYLLDDVLPAMERLYPIRTDRAGRVIAGISMGGAGAAALAFMHPDLFGAVGIHSPALYSSSHQSPPWIFGLGDPAAFSARNPNDLARQLPWDSGLRIFLDCGLDDEFSGPTADLHYTLIERNIPHTYLCRPGEHRFDYWGRHLAEYLGFYAAGW